MINNVYLHFDSCRYEVSYGASCVVSGGIKHRKDADETERFVVKFDCHTESFVPSLPRAK